MNELIKSDNSDYRMVATTMSGLEEVLSGELLKLGARDIESRNRAVSFTGDKGFMYKANYCLRTAIHILKPVFKFNAVNDQELYRQIYRLPWEELLDASKTFMVNAALNSRAFTHTQFVSQKVKDAIVDRLRDKFGDRPSVDKINPDLRIHIHIHKESCTVSLDSSGESLHKRGYRVDTNLAPLNEVLAAGMVLLTGWDKRSIFVNPMCGSGTLLIEAAMYACNIPPGYYREQFGFMKWKDYDEELFNKIKDGVINRISESAPNITGSDISAHVIKKAKKNAASAKVNDVIKFEVSAFDDYSPPKGRGIMVINPPYGERMNKDDVEALYKKMGDSFKKNYAGYDVWMISSNLEALKKVGLHPTRKITLFNGSLECRYMKYSIYEGTKKIHKIQDHKQLPET